MPRLGSLAATAALVPGAVAARAGLDLSGQQSGQFCGRIQDDAQPETTAT